jgi:hypothetical protein
MLGTVALLGTNAAYAIDLDTDDKSATITYAKETLLKTNAGTVEGEVDGKTYYVVHDTVDQILNVTGMVGVGGPAGSTVIIEFVFDNMVLTDTAPTLSIADFAANDVVHRAGGEEGENTISFIATRDSDSQSAEQLVTLDIAEIGLSPDGVGSVTMNVSDNLPLPASKTKSYLGAVRAADALKETAEAAELSMREAQVVTDFMQFGVDENDPDTTANVGSFMVSQETTYNKQDGTGATVLSDLIAPGAIADDGEVVRDGSSVTVTGDFSFAANVVWDSATDCSTAPADGTDLLQRDDDGVVNSDELEARTPAYVNANPNLCIHVRTPDHDDAVAIPETSPYMVTTMYDAGTLDAAFPPSGGTFALGNIARNGTTVRIAYLTTNDRYHQRIVILNRGGDAKYAMSFMVEDGKTATAGIDAKGMLAAGKTTVLSLRDDDIVSITGGTRTSGTLVIEAEQHNISVSSVTHRIDTGNTDTVVLKY